MEKGEKDDARVASGACDTRASCSSTSSRRASSCCFSTCSRWSCERRLSFSSSRSATRPDPDEDESDMTLASRWFRGMAGRRFEVEEGADDPPAKKGGLPAVTLRPDWRTSCSSSPTRRSSHKMCSFLRSREAWAASGRGQWRRSMASSQQRLSDKRAGQRTPVADHACNAACLLLLLRQRLGLLRCSLHPAPLLRRSAEGPSRQLRGRSAALRRPRLGRVVVERAVVRVCVHPRRLRRVREPSLGAGP